MPSTQLERLRAAKKAAAEQAVTTPVTAADLLKVDASTLESALAVANEAATAAHRELEKKRLHVARIETEIRAHEAELEKARAAVKAAVRAGKARPAIPADVTSELEEVLEQTRAELQPLESAVAKANAAVASAKSQIERRAEAERRTTFAAELEPMLVALRDKLASSDFSGEFHVAGFKLTLSRTPAQAASNYREDVSHNARARGEQGKLRYRPGQHGTLELQLSTTVATEAEPAVPEGVLTRAQIVEQDRAESEARFEKHAAAKAKEAAKTEKEWKALQRFHTADKVSRVETL